MATTPVPVKQSAPAPVASPDAWRSFRTELDRLFDRFTGGFAPLSFPPLRFDTAFNAAVPAVDITEDETCFKVSAELPGLSEKDVQVSLAGDMLTIKGEKRQDREEKKEDYHLTERCYGAFQRAFVLPAGVDGEKIAAEFSNGVLTVTMPKTAQATAKTIEVKAAA